MLCGRSIWKKPLAAWQLDGKTSKGELGSKYSHKGFPQ